MADNSFAEKIDTLDLDQLRDLRRKVDAAIKGFDSRRRREALAAAEAVAGQHGFKLAELTRGTRASGKQTVAGEVKYANPEEASQTWTGRGRRPGWVTAALDAGRSLDEFAVAKG